MWRRESGAGVEIWDGGGGRVCVSLSLWFPQSTSLPHSAAEIYLAPPLKKDQANWVGVIRMKWLGISDNNQKGILASVTEDLLTHSSFSLILVWNFFRGPHYF